MEKGISQPGHSLTASLGTHSTKDAASAEAGAYDNINQVYVPTAHCKGGETGEGEEYLLRIRRVCDKFGVKYRVMAVKVPSPELESPHRAYGDEDTLLWEVEQVAEFVTITQMRPN